MDGGGRIASGTAIESTNSRRFRRRRSSCRGHEVFIAFNPTSAWEINSDVGRNTHRAQVSPPGDQARVGVAYRDRYLLLGNCSCIALLQAIHGLMQYLH
jgi:hypothetical protein